MNLTNPYEKYREQSVMAASPGQLTLMLYEGCLKFLKIAVTSIENKNIEEAHNNLIKAGDIISELMATLDTRYEIASHMMSLYIFILNEIKETNIRKDAEKLTVVIDLVKEFRDAWKQALINDRSRRFKDEEYEY
jgi:flagellar protein FliS